MEILIGFALGVFISLIFHEHMMRAVLDRMGIRSQKDIDKLLGVIEAHKPPTHDDQDKTVQQIKVENIKGRLYAYTLPEMQYVGQAESYGELLDVLKDRLDTDAVDIQEEKIDS
jgi:hypothetical protein